MKRSTTTCLRKVVRVFAALIATTLMLPLFPASPAAANVTPNIGTTFDEASLYTPSESAVGTTVEAVTTDADGNIYTASSVWQSKSLSHSRSLGVTEEYVVGRGAQQGWNQLVTKVDKDGVYQWSWELRVTQHNSIGQPNDIIVDSDGTVHYVGQFRGSGHVWHHASGDPARPSVNDDGSLIDGDFIVEGTNTKTQNAIWATINADGTTRHVKTLKSSISSYFESVDLDSNGDVLIAGRNHGNTNLDMNDHVGTIGKSSLTTSYLGKYTGDGDLVWAKRLNECNNNQASSAFSAKFTNDGRIVLVGAYSGTPTWDCSNGGLIRGEPGPMLGNGFATHKTLGTRSYMALFNSTDGEIQYVREIGSATQRSQASEVAVHPTTGDFFIVGMWENTKEESCVAGDEWFFAPKIPSIDFPLVTDLTQFTADGGVVECSAHEGGGINDDHYVLHTDRLGNLKDIKLLDIHLEKAYRPALSMNSDGSEIAIVDSGLRQAMTRMVTAQSKGSNGWIVALGTADLSENWRWVNEDVTPDTETNCQWSFTRDVAYGPNDKVHTAGRNLGFTSFGTTAAGDLGLHSAVTPVPGFCLQTQFNSHVARYGPTGLLDTGAAPEVPQVAPEGYSIVTPQAFQDDDGTYVLGSGGEVVLDEALCAGGRWEVVPQAGLHVRQYMILKENIIDGDVDTAIRVHHTGSNGTFPNYNILWQDGYLLDTDETVGWDEGIAELDAADDLPVGFYFRQNMFAYNINSNPGGLSAYAPGTRVDGNTWDLDDYDVHLAFAHSGGELEAQIYPVVEQICPDTAGFTVSKTSLSTSETGTSDSFTVVLNSEPTAPVVFYIAITDSSEISVDVDVLRFYQSSWDTPIRVTATGRSDSVPDGDITSYINVQLDHDVSSYEYASLTNKIVDVVTTNVDLLPAPPNPDLDGDGILNEDEVDGCVELADCDGDGINDGNEISACILVADCDGDGLQDNQEQVGCIQDPRCTENNAAPIQDEEPVVPETEPVAPENPPAPTPPAIDEPDEDDAPQEPVIPELDEDEGPGNDSDLDGISDSDELPGCELVDDCDADGLIDGEDNDPSNPDSDGDGLVDGSDPNPGNPDTDGDGIPDGEDDDSDGNGIPDDQEQGIPGSGLAPPGEPEQSPSGDGTPDDEDGEVPTKPSQTLDGGDDGDDSKSPVAIRVLTDPKVLVGGGLIAAAGFAWLWFLARAIGFSNGLWWLLWLLLRRRRFCRVCDHTLKKTRDGVWISVETESHLGEDGHAHEPKLLRVVRGTSESGSSNS